MNNQHASCILLFWNFSGENQKGQSANPLFNVEGRIMGIRRPFEDDEERQMNNKVAKEIQTKKKG